MRLLQPGRPDYATNRIIKGQYHYTILTSSAYLTGRKQPLEKIEGKWFEIESEELDALQEGECIPNMKKLLNIALNDHYNFKYL